jgi:uncharacterized membrane protein
MKKIDWRSKLTSRKFWMAIIGVVSAIGIAVNADPETIEKVAAVIMSGGVAIAYILGEGFIDKERIKHDAEE